MPDLRAVVERAADEYLGRHGVVAVYEGVRDGEPVIVFSVVGNIDQAVKGLPTRIEGVRIVVESTETLIPYKPP